MKPHCTRSNILVLQTIRGIKYYLYGPQNNNPFDPICHIFFLRNSLNIKSFIGDIL